jgi:hypothetical protein
MTKYLILALSFISISTCAYAMEDGVTQEDYKIMFSTTLKQRNNLPEFPKVDLYMSQAPHQTHPLKVIRIEFSCEAIRQNFETVMYNYADLILAGNGVHTYVNESMFDVFFKDVLSFSDETSLEIQQKAWR